MKALYDNSKGTDTDPRTFVEGGDEEKRKSFMKLKTKKQEEQHGISTSS